MLLARLMRTGSSGMGCLSSYTSSTAGALFAWAAQSVHCRAPALMLSVHDASLPSYTDSSGMAGSRHWLTGTSSRGARARSGQAPAILLRQ